MIWRKTMPFLLGDLSEGCIQGHVWRKRIGVHLYCNITLIHLLLCFLFPHSSVTLVTPLRTFPLVTPLQDTLETPSRPLHFVLVLFLSFPSPPTLLNTEPCRSMDLPQIFPDLLFFPRTPISGSSPISSSLVHLHLCTLASLSLCVPLSCFYL